MINDDVAPAVITKIRLAIILIVNNRLSRSRHEPGGFSQIFRRAPHEFPGREAGERGKRKRVPNGS